MLARLDGPRRETVERRALMLCRDGDFREEEVEGALRK